MNRTLLVVLLSILLVSSARSASGDLDVTFGNGGKVVRPSTLVYMILAVAVQADGKIVVAGQSSGSNYLLARFNANGSLDQSFGNQGFIRDTAGYSSYYSSIAIQADGKIVAVGTEIDYPTCNGDVGANVARYNADGSHDTSFGIGGRRFMYRFVYPEPCFGSSANAVAIQADGKIVVAGGARPTSSNDFLIARLNMDGSFDTTFSSDGKTTVELGTGTTDRANALDIDPATGRIVVSGFSLNGSNFDFATVLLTAYGSLDTTFSADGKVVTNSGGEDVATAVAFQKGGKVVVAGRQSNGVNGTDFSIVRYNESGSLDSTFGTGGKVVTPFSAYYDAAFGVAIQSSGRIIAAGYGADNDDLGSSYNFALARYTSTGSLDTGFSGDGKQMTSFGTTADFGNAMAIQPDGKIIVAGNDDSPNRNILLARYLP